LYNQQFCQYILAESIVMCEK